MLKMPMKKIIEENILVYVTREVVAIHSFWTQGIGFILRTVLQSLAGQYCHGPWMCSNHLSDNSSAQ